VIATPTTAGFDVVQVNATFGTTVLEASYAMAVSVCESRNVIAGAPGETTTRSTAGCEKTMVWPPIESEADRRLPLRLLATRYETLPGPVPDPPAVIVSQLALLAVDQGHEPARTARVPTAPAAGLAIATGVML
jgi:hypothetical protein